MDAQKVSPIPSLPSRLLKVFFSPGELFFALRERPVWFGALAIAALLVAASFFLIPAELWTEMAREQIRARGQEMPPNMGSATAMIRIFGIFGAGIGYFVWAFIMAGIVTLFFSFFLGDEGKYSQYLSVVSHALIIGALGSLLLVPLRVSQGDVQLTLNLGTFFSYLGDGYLSRVLRMLELFGLWGMAVMAVGVTKIDPKRSLGSALTFFFAFAVASALLFALIPGQG